MGQFCILEVAKWFTDLKWALLRWLVILIVLHKAKFTYSKLLLYVFGSIMFLLNLLNTWLVQLNPIKLCLGPSLHTLSIIWLLSSWLLSISKIPKLLSLLAVPEDLVCSRASISKLATEVANVYKSGSKLAVVVCGFWVMRNRVRLTNFVLIANVIILIIIDSRWWVV